MILIFFNNMFLKYSTEILKIILGCNFSLLTAQSNTYIEKNNRSVRKYSYAKVGILREYEYREKVQLQ